MVFGRSTAVQLTHCGGPDTVVLEWRQGGGCSWRLNVLEVIRRVRHGLRHTNSSQSVEIGLARSIDPRTREFGEIFSKRKGKSPRTQLNSSSVYLNSRLGMQLLPISSPRSSIRSGQVGRYLGVVGRKEEHVYLKM